MSLKTIIQQIDLWDDSWKNSYNDFVPKFIEEASTKADWKDWNQEVFKEYFERVRNQCVSSLQQGYFTRDERKKIKENWSEIGPLLKQIALVQDRMQIDTYNQLARALGKYTTQNRFAATNRLIAGLQPQLLSTIVNDTKLSWLIYYLQENIENCTLKKGTNWYESSNAVLTYFASELQQPANEIMALPWQVYEFFSNGNTVKSNDMSDLNADTLEIIQLLNYKKQIILQGPPGTGKTKLAKELAIEMVKLTPAVIRASLKVGDKIDNASGAAEYYTIKEIGEETISLVSDRTTQDWKPSYQEIISKYTRLRAGEKVENTNGLNPYELAVAKHFFNDPDRLNFSEEIKIIQFHPNYSYEDFVRGIVVKTNGDKLEYVAEDKILARMAIEALDNYRNSQKDASMISYEKWVEKQFPGFVKSIKEQLDHDLVKLTDKVDVVGVDDDEAFRYKGKKGWTKKGNRMLFDDLIQAIADQNATRQDLKKNANLSGLARWHASYYIRMVDLFRKYVNDKNLVHTETVEQIIPLQNYVLIIDEINRANLSAVLGELIYAMEYRGEAVEGMYEVNNNELILPPNLYIIGTMNTADRSTGTIDYAIRRRFAFVNVPARNLLEEGEKDFAIDLFVKVSALFDTNISPEFDKVDVQLGHSYFIGKTTDEEHPVGMDIRWKYEIQPILLEYVKDGILIGEVEGTPIKQYIQEWVE